MRFHRRTNSRWCRAENLAHSLRNGTESMWVATGPTPEECHAQADDLEFLNSNLRVFQGEATVEADKLTLVPAVLGLYAELFALALHNGVEPGAAKQDTAWAVSNRVSTRVSKRVSKLARDASAAALVGVMRMS